MILIVRICERALILLVLCGKRSFMKECVRRHMIRLGRVPRKRLRVYELLRRVRKRLELGGNISVFVRSFGMCICRTSSDGSGICDCRH